MRFLHPSVDATLLSFSLEVDRVLRINIYHTYRQEKPGRWEWNLKIVGHVLDPEVCCFVLGLFQFWSYRKKEKITFVVCFFVETNQPIESEIEKSTYKYL